MPVEQSNGTPQPTKTDGTRHLYIYLYSKWEWNSINLRARNTQECTKRYGKKFFVLGGFSSVQRRDGCHPTTTKKIEKTAVDTPQRESCKKHFTKNTIRHTIIVSQHSHTPPARPKKNSGRNLKNKIQKQISYHYEMEAQGARMNKAKMDEQKQNERNTKKKLFY